MQIYQVVQMTDTLSLCDALAASERQQATYRDEQRWAFVAEMEASRFDIGVNVACEDAGDPEIFCDQTAAQLRAVLPESSIPLDTGWQPR